MGAKVSLEQQAINDQCVEEAIKEINLAIARYQTNIGQKGHICVLRRSYRCSLTMSEVVKRIKSEAKFGL